MSSMYVTDLESHPTRRRERFCYVIMFNRWRVVVFDLHFAFFTLHYALVGLNK